MRGAVIAVLVFIVGAIITLVLEKVVKDAPEWIWRLMYGAVVIGPLIIILLSDPCYGYLAEFRKYALASTLIIAFATAIIVGTVWIFGIVGFPSSKSYLAGMDKPPPPRNELPSDNVPRKSGLTLINAGNSVGASVRDNKFDNISGATLIDARHTIDADISRNQATNIRSSDDPKPPPSPTP